MEEGGPATPFAAEELGEFTLCAYCTERYAHICGGSDTTRSGDPVCAGVTVAVDPEVIPLGSTLYIEGIGFRKAQDTGSAIRGQTIDLAVGRHSDALSFGVQHRRVWLVQ
nr:3D domain-containing protein [Acetanaerobacterium sp. MSJ-12]